MKPGEITLPAASMTRLAYRGAADINDLVALDRDIGPHPGPAGAVNDLTALDQDVGLAGRLGQNIGGAGKEEQGKNGRDLKNGLVSNHHTGLPYSRGLTTFYVPARRRLLHSRPFIQTEGRRRTSLRWSMPKR